MVGDAAGHCLPVTGEGIRPALTFGTFCGRSVQQVIRGELTLPEGLARYRRRVLGRRWVYRTLETIQQGILALPPLLDRGGLQGVGLAAGLLRLLGVVRRTPAASRGCGHQRPVPGDGVVGAAVRSGPHTRRTFVQCRNRASNDRSAEGDAISR